MIFGKTLDKMLHFQFILKSITYRASFWSPDSKNDTCCKVGNQVSSVSLATLIAHITVYNPGLKYDGHAQPNITRSLIWKSLFASSMLQVLLNWLFTFQLWKIFGTDMGVLSIVLYKDFFKVIPTATLGSHSQSNMIQSIIFGFTVPTLNEASVAPHQSKIGTAPIMTWWLPGLSFSVVTIQSA